MKMKIIIISALCLFFISCEESIDGNQIDFKPIIKNIKVSNKQLLNPIQPTLPLSISDSIPTTREDLSNMRQVYKIYKGNVDAGISVPGFGGYKLGKKESSLSVYYVETKEVKMPTDTVIYGIGYSIHYLFKKVKKGIDIQNLGSVAASAQLQNKKTSVSYTAQTYGIYSLNIAKYFKPLVNSNYDVSGFGVVQSNIDGIHNILTDSLLSSKTKFTPELLSFITPDDLRR